LGDELFNQTKELWVAKILILRLSLSKKYPASSTLSVMKTCLDLSHHWISKNDWSLKWSSFVSLHCGGYRFIFTFRLQSECTGLQWILM